MKSYQLFYSILTLVLCLISSNSYSAFQSIAMDSGCLSDSISYVKTDRSKTEEEEEEEEGKNEITDLSIPISAKSPATHIFYQPQMAETSPASKPKSKRKVKPATPETRPSWNQSTNPHNKKTGLRKKSWHVRAQKVIATASPKELDEFLALKEVGEPGYDPKKFTDLVERLENTRREVYRKKVEMLRRTR